MRLQKMIKKFTIVVTNLYEEKTPISIAITANDEVTTVDDLIIAQHVYKVMYSEGIRAGFVDVYKAVIQAIKTNCAVIYMKYETHVITKFDSIEDPSLCTAQLDLYPNDFFNVKYYTVGDKIIIGDTDNKLIHNVVDCIFGNTTRGKSYYAAKVMLESFDHFMYNEMEVCMRYAKSLEDIKQLYTI